MKLVLCDAPYGRLLPHNLGRVLGVACAWVLAFPLLQEAATLLLPAWKGTENISLHAVGRRYAFLGPEHYAADTLLHESAA